jgi:hypothetical protein
MRTIAILNISRPRVGLAAFALALGCSLALDLDEKVPCESDSDCTYSGGPGQCIAGFCAPGEPGDDDGSGGPTTTTPGTDTGDTSSDTSEPATSSGTTLGLDDTSSSSDTASTECTLNSECDEDERCDDGTCVGLLSPECQILRYPAGVDRDKVVYIGSIMPTAGIFENLVTPLQNATQLAIDDFNDVATLQGGREVAWVGCDDTDGADQAVAAAMHLVDNVGVPAIVGPIFSESVLAIAEQVTVDAGVFVISPTASAESLTNIDDDNLVWRVTPSDVYQVNGILDRMVEDPTPPRLLVLYKDDAYGSGIFNGIQTDLVQSLPDAEIHFAAYENPAVFGGDQQALLESYGLVLGTALSQPGIAQSGAAYDSPDDHYTHVLVLGTSEMQALVTSYVGVWAQLYNFAPMPRFIVSHGAVPQMELTVEQLGLAPGTEALAPLRPLLFSSIEGITPNVFDEDNFTAFNIRYKIAFMNQDALTSSSLSYDATLSALFAAVTVPGSDPITGAAIAQGMASLNDARGTYVTFGGAGLQFIQLARNALASGNTVDLQGVSGALDWDPGNGELRANLIGWGLAGTPDMATLDAQRAYVLDPAPATDGTWVDL